MKINQVFEKNKLILNKKNIESADLEAVLILALAIKKDKEFIFAHPDKNVSFFDFFKNQLLLYHRLKNIPLAYLAGHKEFYGFDFLVNKNTLIPRPETELMVDEVLKIISNYNFPTVDLIDVGTGSGCIIISLVKKLKEKGLFGNFYGLDISRKALRVARLNAKKNGTADCINFLHSNLLKKINIGKIVTPLFITANLPYLSPDQIKSSISIQKEPKIALVAGSDGLDLYRRFFKEIRTILPILKSELFVLCEIDNSQGLSLKALLVNFFPKIDFEIKQDLGGENRLAILHFK